jgi:branched-chain amino acid transport system substrate-binding protein
MSKQHTHHDGCHELGRRKFLGLAAATASLAVIPIRAEASNGEIVIGGTLAQSGPLQGVVRPFTDLGQKWVESVNARGGIKVGGKTYKLKMIVYDDQSDPPNALKLYERLATVDKVNLFIGPFTSFLTNAALQASVTHKLPFFMVEANDSIMFENPNPWRATGLAPAQLEHKRTADLFEKVGGVKTFALLARDSLHENQSMEGFGDWVRKAGFEVVYQEIAPKDVRDFASIILAMKQKNPDVVFIESIPPPYTIGFLKQARELGLNPKDVVVGHCYVPVIKALGGGAENLMSSQYFFDGDSPDHKEFFALCKAAGFEPWQYSEAGIRYVTYKRIEDALEHAGSLKPEAIRDAMWKADFSLYGGGLVIKQDEKGYGTLYPWPCQVHSGKLESLWPLERGAKDHHHKMGKW